MQFSIEQRVLICWALSYVRLLPTVYFTLRKKITRLIPKSVIIVKRTHKILFLRTIPMLDYLDVLFQELRQ